MIFSEKTAIMHVQVTPADTHFHSLVSSNNHRHHLPYTHQRQSSHHSYDTIDTSVWQQQQPTLMAANRFNSSSNNNGSGDGMGGSMSWSDDNNAGGGGGSCVDDISEEDDNEFDESGRKKVG